VGLAPAGPGRLAAEGAVKLWQRRDGVLDHRLADLMKLSPPELKWGGRGQT
jgi:hypothetical protein